MPVSKGASTEKNCEEICQNELKTNYQSSEFGFGSDGDAKSYKCNQTHKAFLEAEAAKTATQPTSANKPVPIVPPQLNVPIPNLKFTDAIVTDTTIKTSFLAEYINAIYKYMIGIGITIAIVMIMIGGLQYVLGAGSGNVDKGKERIKNGIVGLILLWSVFLILHTVNPQLVSLKMVELQTVKEIDLPEDEGEIDASAIRVCDTIAACQQLCAQPKNAWPTSNPKTIDPTETIKAQSANGFVNDGGNTVKGRVTLEVQTALQKAGQIATGIDPSYSIHLVSGFRPLVNQIQKVCDVLATEDPNKIAKIGKAVAWPGGSNHGSGAAIDVLLMKGNSALTDPTFNTTYQNNPNYKVGAELLSKIMTNAGFVRYGAEIWHFELKEKAGSTCRCEFPNCPFPAKC